MTRLRPSTIPILIIVSACVFLALFVGRTLWNLQTAHPSDAEALNPDVTPSPIGERAAKRVIPAELPPTVGRETNDRIDEKTRDPELGTVIQSSGAAVVREAEQDPRLVGDQSYSGVVSDGPRSVLTIAQSSVEALYYLSVPPHPRYLVELRARHDAPAPVGVLLTVNGKPWKRLSLTRGDAAYRTHRVGILRNFSGGVLGIQLTNDVFDGTALRTCSDEICRDVADRNLYVDWFRLVPIQ